MSLDSQGYGAFLVSPDFGREAVAGVLTPKQWGFEFVGKGVEVEFPYQRLSLQTGGLEGDAVYFHDLQRPMVTLYTEGDEILEDSVFKRNPYLKAQVLSKAPRRINDVFLTGAWKFLAVFGGIVLVVMIVVSQLGRIAVDHVPAEWEAEYGEAVVSAINEERMIAERGETVEALEALSSKIQAGKETVFQSPKIYLLEENEPNAFALPGGSILVTRGLLHAAERPEEIAGVLAHELAHLNRRHFVRQALLEAGPMLVTQLLFGDENGLFSLVGEGSRKMLERSFSREFEREADDLAWEYLTGVNIDPRGLAEFLRKIRDSGETYFGSLDSHPPTDERIENLDQKWEAYRGSKDFETLDWRVLDPRTLIE